MRARRLLAMAPAVAALVALPATPATAAECGVSAAPGEDSLMQRLVNGARSAAGLSPLGTNRPLAAGARRHSVSMAATGTLRHMVSNGRLTWAPTGAVAGENVGYGGDTRTVFRMLMASPPHKANILGSRFRTLGVGAVSACGSIFFAMRFQG